MTTTTTTVVVTKQDAACQSLVDSYLSMCNCGWQNTRHELLKTAADVWEDCGCMLCIVVYHRVDIKHSFKTVFVKK